MPLMMPAAVIGIHDHLDGPDRGADRPEQREVDREHQADALPRVRRIYVALDPVVRRADAVFLHRFKIPGFVAIQFGAFQQDLLDASCLRAVRIVGRFYLGVVLAVDGDPFLGQHAGGQPQPEPEKVRDDGMQVEAAVRLAAMQIDGHRGDRDVRQCQRDYDIPPPRQRHQAVGEERKRIEGHGFL